MRRGILLLCVTCVTVRFLLIGLGVGFRSSVKGLVGTCGASLLHMTLLTARFKGGLVVGIAFRIRT